MNATCLLLQFTLVLVNNFQIKSHKHTNDDEKNLKENTESHNTQTHLKEKHFIEHSLTRTHTCTQQYRKQNKWWKIYLYIIFKFYLLHVIRFLGGINLKNDIVKLLLCEICFFLLYFNLHLLFFCLAISFTFDLSTHKCRRRRQRRRCCPVVLQFYWYFQRLIANWSDFGKIFFLPKIIHTHHTQSRREINNSNNKNNNKN